MSIEETDFWYTQYGIPEKRGSLLPRTPEKNARRSWRVTTPPVIEPVSVEEVKLLGRIDSNSEDGLITSFIAAVRERAEELIGRAFITQSLTMRMDWWPSKVIKLPRPPAQTITSVTTLDEDDAVITTYAAADYYYLDTNSEPGQLIWRQGASEPSNTSRDYQGYQVIWVAGYGDTETDVPQGIREAIKYWILSLYENRVPDLKKPPPEAAALLAPFKLRSVFI